MYPKLREGEEVPADCEIYKLVQNQCTYDGNKVMCLPFKRVFLRCLENKSKEIVGYKIKPLHRKDAKDGGDKVYRDIEITRREDNDYPINKEMVEFLKAEQVLKEKMSSYYEKHR